MPPKNPVRIVEMACVVLPKTRTSWRDQTTSYIRPAAPDRMKMARIGQRRDVTGGPQWRANVVVGWRGRIRTFDLLIQSQAPYRLATRQWSRGIVPPRASDGLARPDSLEVPRVLS